MARHQRHPQDTFSAAEERDRQRRLQALSDLARQRLGASLLPSVPASATPSAPGELAAPLRRRPALWMGAAFLALVLVLVGVGVARAVVQQPSPAQVTGSHGPMVLSLSADFNCPVDVAWSPDGRRIAVLGYHLFCPNSHGGQGYEPGQVDVYDATTGALLSRFQPDTAILNGHDIALGPETIDPTTAMRFNPFIAFSAILWSPDGQRLSLPFVLLHQRYIFPSPTTPPTANPTPLDPTTAGVLVADAAGQHTQVLSTPYQLTQTDTPSTLEWDLNAGVLVSSAVTLPPALTYRWGARGAVSVAEPLPASGTPASPPPSAIGNPAGGATFTIWQPGVASQGQIYPPGGTAGQATKPYSVPGLHLWYTNIASWSPDGSYLLAPAYYGGRVALPAETQPSLATLTAAGQDQAPQLPARDTALAHLFASARPTTVAWRPDGRVVAAMTSLAGPNSAAHAHLTLYDAATGTTLATLTLQSGGNQQFDTTKYKLGPSAENTYLRWSPDGSRLLLLAANLSSAMTIWGPGQLPQ